MVWRSSWPCNSYHLAMTFGVSYMLGIDLPAGFVATLIIALGLLVDVPVVAGDVSRADLPQAALA